MTVDAGGQVELARQALLMSGADLGPAHDEVPMVGERSGTASSSEVWRGNERRYNDDVNYAGPERRLATR